MFTCKITLLTENNRNSHTLNVKYQACSPQSRSWLHRIAVKRPLAQKGDNGSSVPMHSACFAEELRCSQQLTLLSSLTSLTLHTHDREQTTEDAYCSLHFRRFARIPHAQTIPLQNLLTRDLTYKDLCRFHTKTWRMIKSRKSQMQKYIQMYESVRTHESKLELSAHVGVSDSSLSTPPFTKANHI